MNRKTTTHLSQKIEDLMSVDGQLMSLSSVVREINRLNGRPIGDAQDVAKACMVYVLKELRRAHGE